MDFHGRALVTTVVNINNIHDASSTQTALAGTCQKHERQNNHQYLLYGQLIGYTLQGCVQGVMKDLKNWEELVMDRSN